MSDKVKFDELTDLFKAIEIKINETNMPQRQKQKWIMFTQKMTKAGHFLAFFLMGMLTQRPQIWPIHPNRYKKHNRRF